MHNSTNVAQSEIKTYLDMTTRYANNDVNSEIFRCQKIRSKTKFYNA